MDASRLHCVDGSRPVLCDVLRLSKSHDDCRVPCRWMVLSGNKAIAKDYIEGWNMLTNMRICSNVPAQSIIQTALGGHQSVNDYIVPGGRI